ncbi:3'(2'),5'-bisphosphate nucleotidase CysQ [Pelagibacterium sediminicola]|uniref:3'(2'),5'-bisphosphate nucleotidase CysQ n=1 Tax=Pelagibacterium sediminicola TaxID=2248761 RepID=UPI000E318CFB|nr:3'(2'),5'-bisphosphate nucleotidase CysQ [Pelagibacterium sediminicola]
MAFSQPAAFGADLVTVLVDTALAAGARIMEIYGRDFSVVTKADQTPLTEADIAAEALILAALAAHFPDIPVIAEEAVANGEAPDCGTRFFLVDPLDGSREFISRNGEFTVNIALIEDGAPVAGVVYAPALKRIWWGRAGAGAQVAVVEEGRCLAPSRAEIRRPGEDGIVVVGSRSHADGEREARYGTRRVARFMALGSSLKFCLLAEGQADLYPRNGRTMEWDTAAGDAVLRAAGGIVLCGDGQPMRYGKRNQPHDIDFANGPFVAYGDESLRDGS